MLHNALEETSVHLEDVLAAESPSPRELIEHFEGVIFEGVTYDAATRWPAGFQSPRNTAPSSAARVREGLGATPSGDAYVDECFRFAFQEEMEDRVWNEFDGAEALRDLVYGDRNGKRDPVRAPSVDRRAAAPCRRHRKHAPAVQRGRHG